MADIVNLFDKTILKSEELKNPVSVNLIKHFNSCADDFKELLILYRKEDGTVGVWDTEVPIEDKCLFLQMLQHQVVSYLDVHRTPISIEEDK